MFQRLPWGPSVYASTHSSGSTPTFISQAPVPPQTPVVLVYLIMWPYSHHKLQWSSFISSCGSTPTTNSSGPHSSHHVTLLPPQTPVVLVHLITWSYSHHKLQWSSFISSCGPTPTTHSSGPPFISSCTPYKLQWSYIYSPINLMKRFNSNINISHTNYPYNNLYYQLNHELNQWVIIWPCKIYEHKSILFYAMS